MSTSATGYWATDTDDKEALVIASWKAGHSAGEIAGALQERFGGKLTRQAVLGKIGRLRLPENRLAALKSLTPSPRPNRKQEHGR